MRYVDYDDHAFYCHSSHDFGSRRGVITHLEFLKALTSAAWQDAPVPGKMAVAV
jgi:hypothetical protein